MGYRAMTQTNEDNPRETQLPRLQLLHSLVGKLPQNKQSFASDLMRSFRQWKRLTDKQMEWVEKLIVMANEPPEATAENQVQGQKIPGFDAVKNLLLHAQQHIQFPVIRLRTEKGQKITLRPYSGTSVKVQVNGEHGGAWGVVSGEFLDTKSLRFLADLTDVLNTLHQMAAHPLETAVLYGKKYKSCCFCGISLTDPRSIVMGYGPICANNYGLPWGEETLPEVSVEELEQLLEAQEHER